MTWWVLYSEPRRELFARDRLLDAGLSVFCPFERVTRRQVVARQHGWRSRTWGERVRERTVVKTRDEPVFPRYLFAEGDVPALLAIRGVQDVVRGTAREPVAVPDRILDALRGVTGSDGLTSSRDVSRLSTTLRWKVGDQAVLKPSSPLAGLMTTLKSVAKLDDTGEIEVYMTLFGRVTNAVMSYTEVERVISAEPRARLQAAA